MPQRDGHISVDTSEAHTFCSLLLMRSCNHTALLSSPPPIRVRVLPARGMAKENYGDFGTLGLRWCAKVSRRLPYCYVQVASGSSGKRNDLTIGPKLPERSRRGVPRIRQIHVKMPVCTCGDRSLNRFSVRGTLLDIFRHLNVRNRGHRLSRKRTL